MQPNISAPNSVMKHNHVIESTEDLLKHFGASQKLEIVNLQQMKNFLYMDVPLEVWENASNINLLSFSQEFVQQTKEFSFNYGRIKKIYLISFLTNLTELNLSENYISDISSISKLKNLKKLELEDNFIENISALQLLTVTHLNLFKNKLTSYTVALPNLVELSLECNELQDKSGLQHSPKLEMLDLTKTETTDLRNIPPQLFGLKELCLSQNNITEISHLSNFVELQILKLNKNKQLQNIGPLKFCTQLTELSISETGVADIWPLQFMKNLKALYMDNTQVVDLHPLQHLYQLEYISAFVACIIDVSPLSKFTQLNLLHFWNNKIINADTLQHHTNFSKFIFSNQKVPTTDELKFYNRILSVHSSHKQIIKLIQTKNRVSKFRESLTHRKEQFKLKINEQIQDMNKKIEIWAQFIQNSYADQ
ncbi:leucine-rich_repeat domain-containing protein [Hexamita inflata]|uniref:Leucine-rich repeat domain-containing protein n=1 Tax=Hexamita inflata TaxID=28002 RepID=A0AA86NQB2_9EUKA|nr:leucine-rich repeat domain-containing protein [Hexamita inflata]